MTRTINDFKETDPIFGERRRKLVSKYYGRSNPFRQGADLAANIAVGSALTFGAGLGSLYSLAATKGLLTAVPVVLGSVAGGYLGSQVADAASEAVNGKTWAENAADIGMSPYNQVLSNPGGWGGSYLGSYITGNAIANFKPWLYNTNSRMTMTPDGPIMLEPGESYVINGRPVSYQTGRQGQTGYQGRYTSKPFGARGSSSGQGGHSVSSNGTKVVSRGLSNRTMRDVLNGGSGTRGSVEFETVPYRYVNGISLPFW